MKQRIVACLCVAVMALNSGNVVYAAETEKLSEDTVTVEETNINSTSTAGIVASGTQLGLEWSIDGNGLLTITGTGNYNTLAWKDHKDKIKSAKVSVTGITSTMNMFSNCTELTKIDFTGSDFSQVTDMNQMFHDCTSLETLDVSGLDTSKVKNMWAMFRDCSSLKTLKVNGRFCTAQVTNMGEMFRGCSSLTSLDLSSFDTSQVTNMNSMFDDCSSLTSLNVSKFNTSQVTSMNGMFLKCGSLSSLNVSSFDTSKVTDMVGMFQGCSSLTSLDVSSFDTGNVTDMHNMFCSCSNLTSLKLNGKFNTGKVTDMSSMFDMCKGLPSLDVSSFNTSKVTNMSCMFASCEKLTGLNVSRFDTSQVTNMSSMFYHCMGLKSMNVSKFNTGKVTSMAGMFQGCSSLTSLNVSNFDTSNSLDMSNMFHGCSGLTSLNLSNFNTSKVRDMNDMFNSCSNLTSLNLTNFNTSQVTNMEDMFCLCGKLENLNVSSFNTSKVRNMSCMFGYCSGLTSLNLGNFNTSQVINMTDMFYNCGSLTSLDLSSFDTGKVTNYNDMLKLCFAMKSIKFPKNLSVEIPFPSIYGYHWEDEDRVTWDTAVTGLTVPMTYKTVVSTYKVVVNNGTGDGIYKAGDTVTITADPPEEGMRFKNWERVEGFFNFKNSKSGTTTFTMPAGEVEVTAIYEEREEIHKVIVNNGSIENPSEDGYYSVGDKLTITAEPPEEGMEFSNWEVASGTVSSFKSSGNTATFVVGESDVEITAVYKKIEVRHKVTVINGSIENPSEDGYYSPGEYITVIADPPEEGKRVYFWSWIDEEGKQQYWGLHDSTLTFKMREIDLELVAVYEWIPGVHPVELVHGDYATCTKEGMKLHYRCTDPGCGKIFKDIDGTQEITMEDIIIPARGHRMKEEWSSDEEKHWHKCKSASCTVVEDVAEHTYGEWTVTKEATETEDGTKERSCTICEYKQTEVIPMVTGDIDITSVPTITVLPTTMVSPTETVTPVITGADRITEQPKVTEPLKATVTPKPTEELTVTVTPTPTGGPTATVTPKLTEKPVVTITPKATGVPTPTKALVVTVVPTMTGKPTGTALPTVTAQPLETITPAVTGTLPGTATPAVTGILPGTATPAVTGTLPGTVTPAMTTKPTVTPMVTRTVTKIPTPTLTAAKKKLISNTKSEKDIEKLIKNTDTEKSNLKGSVFSKLKLKAIGKTKAIKLSWTKQEEADGYMIYGTACGKDTKMKKVKTITKVGQTSWTQNSLKTGKYYKYIIVAYKNVAGQKRIITTSTCVYATTKGDKYANASKVTVNKKNLVLKKGKTATMKATYKASKQVQTHIAVIGYESSNNKIATVTKKGKVTAKAKGNCTIYVYTQNGLYTTVKVKVK